MHSRCARTGRLLVKVDPRYYRPSEVEQLLGNPAKARDRLGWTATVKFPELVRIMVEADLRQEGLDPRQWMQAAGGVTKQAGGGIGK